VASSTDGRVDTLYLDGRSVNNPATIDQGYAEVEFDEPPAGGGLGGWTGSACSAINDTSSTSYGQVGSVKFAHTTAGTERLLLVGISINNNQYEYTTGVTFAGQPLTVVDSINSDNDARSEIWGLVDPPFGTDTVEITFNQTLAPLSNGVAGAISFVGVNQGSPYGASRTMLAQAPAGLTMSLWVPSTTDQLIFSVANAEEVGTLTPVAPLTDWWNLNYADTTYGAGGTRDAAADSTFVEWTLGLDDHRSMAAVALNPAACAPVGTPRLSSEANQTFVVGDPSFAAVVDTIADDATTPTITDAANLRLRIPAGFNMIWDTTVTTVSIGGAASAKVETALLPYEDGGLTLVLDVNTDFLAGDRRRPPLHGLHRRLGGRQPRPRGEQRRRGLGHR
jgi:hypothetical protein